jgi:hypothetical protein
MIRFVTFLLIFLIGFTPILFWSCSDEDPNEEILSSRSIKDMRTIPIPIILSQHIQTL